jgi:hypothetical protein
MATRPLPAEIVRILIILFPELLTALEPWLGRGFIAILINILQDPDRDLARELDQKLQAAKEKSDNSSVIKVSEAIKCVEEAMKDGKLLIAVIKGLVNALISKNFEGAPRILLDTIVTCIREHALRQDTPRVFSKTFRYHRPSKGHGHGRTKFGA